MGYICQGYPAHGMSTYYRLALPEDKEYIYNQFSLAIRLEAPTVVAIRGNKMIGYLGTTITDDIAICGPGKVIIDNPGIVWMKLHFAYDYYFQATGRKGYLIWVDEEDAHWAGILARLPRFTIIGRERGKFWYKRVYPEANNGRQQERASTRNVT